ncbi:MAG: DNA mismatch repair protein MutS, partial [Desulfovibrionaceae bacterium]|nr:DNA mismatch repair protein MutS [Desulfovibrionaceae bacterium]
LWQWVLKVRPRELLLPQGMEIPKEFSDHGAQVNELPAGHFFDPAGAAQRVLKAQQVAGLEVLDLAGKPQLVQACGALLAYVRQTQKQDPAHLGEFRPLNLSRHLIVDEISERNLEIFQRLDGGGGKGTLWQVLDRTMTPMGGRLLEDRLKRPWRDAEPIVETQDAVAFFFERDGLRMDLREGLKAVYDLERLSTRVVLGRATPKDFAALRQSLAVLPAVRPLLSGRDAPRAVDRIAERWDDLADMADLLNRALADNPPPVITDGGLFRPGFDPQLDELIQLTEHGQARMNELLEAERQTCDMPKLKLGFNKIFGYFFEISKAYKGRVPEHFIRRQTLVNSERYVTLDLKDLEERILSASDQRKHLEYALFQDLRQTVAEARDRLMIMSNSLAWLDYWQGLAEAAREQDWTRPEVHPGPDLDIRAGRHPVIEAAVGRANYIPNNLRLDPDRPVVLITGPNMAGKSTVLRQVALMVVMAQMGSFVPADSASMGLADRVFSRVGASDNLAQGRSTFMVEMMETARILRQAGKRSLIILDELGRGTSTFDGLALAWAVVEELCARQGGIRTLFATHYHELTALEGVLPGLRNLNIAVKEWRGDIVFLRKLVPGPADKSYGVEVAKLAGVPKPVVDRARDILAVLEEKKHNAGAIGSPRLAGQPLLPGMEPRSEARAEVQEHPLSEALRELDVDAMTPLEALTLLHKWKKDLDGQD